MAVQKTKKSNGDNIPQNLKPAVDIKEKIRKHIADINDRISEEDIRDAQMPAEESEDEKNALLTENKGANKANDKETPWDTVEGGD